MIFELVELVITVLGDFSREGHRGTSPLPGSLQALIFLLHEKSSAAHPRVSISFALKEVPFGVGAATFRRLR